MMTTKEQKVAVGGYCSTIAGLCFLFGIGVYVRFFLDHQYGDISAPFDSQLRVLSEHSLLLNAWYFIIYIVFGLALLGFQIGVEPLQKTGGVRQASAVLGYFWMALTIATGMLANVAGPMVVQLASHDREAASFLWYAMQMVIEGIGGGNELVGGLWMITLALTLRGVSAFEQGLRVLAFAVGMMGVLSCAPSLVELGGIFGVGCIIWFLAMGIRMIRFRGRFSA